MATVRYLGSKVRVVREILELVGAPRAGDGFFVDAFCGTGVVAAGAADRGWRVRINDHLRCATIMSRARLIAPADVPFEQLGGYASAIEALNDASHQGGFFWREYSPEGGRMYFTESNARRIDAARSAINSWEAEGALTAKERDLLVADLITAANDTANIAGTYGCYLSHLTSNAKRPLALEPRPLRSEPIEHEVSSIDVTEVPMTAADFAYFDPPYTKRQYAAYYHVLETLAWGDEPQITGKTGLRPWQDKASDYCYKSRALGALTELLESAEARRIFLSYSSEGHVALDELETALGGLGEVTVHEIAAIGRYRPNQKASAAGDVVTEFVVELEKSPQPAEALALA
jgi:adenine-specific DNA-methyltransferase